MYRVEHEVSLVSDLTASDSRPAGRFEAHVGVAHVCVHGEHPVQGLGLRGGAQRGQHLLAGR